VNSFDRIHPGLQHHIVNSLGWRTLRPLQEESIGPILDGSHALLLAPTAGGKTEAAFFPILSRMLSNNWSGLSVLYVCPIKALLNNLEFRLSQYCALVGRRCALWHGDITTPNRNRIIIEPPDCLLTTPESLEVMLVSKRTNNLSLFGNLQAVIVDEIHAFAGDDRGWHLLAVLERLTKIAGRELQRVGLSATVGNPDGLMTWLSGPCVGDRQVIMPETGASKDADVKLDYVGNLQNAAIVISRLHRGEKRLVFCDSRARVEELASRLRSAQVETYVSHSSLSVDERRKAETAFASGGSCVIVATSTLELGLDVGDLDRVIQIDAPSTVSSLLQRMGRTGRRTGSQRNCLLLATSRNALVRAAGLLRLWESGYVEPIVPPPKPFHIFAQQVMALALQENGIGVQTWRDWIGRMPAFAAMSTEQIKAILGYMIEKAILWNDNELLWFGKQGEETFGHKNFMELFSVFNSPPLFSVRHGQIELGQVHELSFMTRTDERPVLLLAGKSWAVTHLDWSNRIAYVEPTEQEGKSRWLGSSQALSFELCQSIRNVLASGDSSHHWSQRAKEQMVEIRAEFDWVGSGETTLIASRSAARATWWTFGGMRANAALAQSLRQSTGLYVSFDNLAIRVDGNLSPEAFSGALRSTREGASASIPKIPVDEAVEGLKFSQCLPVCLAEEMLRERLRDAPALISVVSESVRSLSE
jgi:ATP-dependent helicase Lhr and Lhr-like helicase